MFDKAERHSVDWDFTTETNGHVNNESADPITPEHDAGDTAAERTARRAMTASDVSPPAWLDVAPWPRDAAKIANDPPLEPAAAIAAELATAPAVENGSPYSRYKEAEAERAKAHQARPLTPADIIKTWQSEGRIERVPTGFPTLDDACRGGLPVPWRVTIVGAPSAGKTAVALILAKRLEAAGFCVGILGIDEEPEDHAARVAQMCGFTIAQCESREPEVLEAMAAKMATLRMRFYDSTHTIESAADDLGAWATTEKRKAVFVVDTVQTARSDASANAKSPRETVEGNAAALRAVTSKHRLLLVALSEANRGSYRSEDAAETANDMAAGAESRALEFMAQTLMMLRTPKGHADVVHARVPKNRKGSTAGFEFWLRLDRDRHDLAECSDPTSDPGEVQRGEQERRTRNLNAVERDARKVLRIVAAQPGLGKTGLRAAVKAAGSGIGHDLLDACLVVLVQSGRVENRPETHGSRLDAHYFAVSAGGTEE
jgi:RecA/RadA recombinase